LCDQDIADIPLSISDKQLLFIFRSFHLHQQSHGHPVHQMISVTQGEFNDFKEGPNCPVIPSLIMESLPMSAYSLNDPAVMEHPLSSHSQEDIETNDEPANFLLSSSHEAQAMPTLLAPVLLTMDPDTSMTTDVDLTATMLDPVTTSDPCQDHVDDAHDPCIDLLGGETLPYQLYQLHLPSADLEPKKSYPLDPLPQDVTGLLLTSLDDSASLSPKLLLPSLVDSASLSPMPAQTNIDSGELILSNAMLESTKPEVADFPVAQVTSGPSVAALLHADSARNNILPLPMVAPSTAPTVPDRPPAAPDPVTGITLPKTHVPYDFTCELQLAYPVKDLLSLSLLLVIVLFPVIPPLLWSSPMPLVMQLPL